MFSSCGSVLGGPKKGPSLEHNVRTDRCVDNCEMGPGCLGPGVLRDMK